MLNKKLLMGIILSLLLVTYPKIIFSASISSGVIVSNNTFIDYHVGIVSQATIYFNTDTFVVDNKIDLIVTTIDQDGVSVNLGDTAKVLTYKVTNKGNIVQDYSLNSVGLGGSLFGVTNSIELTNIRVVVDVNSNGIYDPSVDNDTFIDELARGSSVYVFIVSYAKPSVGEHDDAVYDLVAQTAEGGRPGFLGANITNDDNGNVTPGGTANNVPDNPDLIEIVFADGAGIVDDLYEGRFSSRNSFIVDSSTQAEANISVVASASLNGTSQQKAIPNSTITYSLDIYNSGPFDATSVVLFDQIPANTTFANGSVTTSNSNVDASVNVEYSSDGVTWSDTETAQVAYIRATFSIVDANNGDSDGTAQLRFNVTIN